MLQNSRSTTAVEEGLCFWNNDFLGVHFLKKAIHSIIKQRLVPFIDFVLNIKYLFIPFICLHYCFFIHRSSIFPILFLSK